MSKRRHGQNRDERELLVSFVARGWIVNARTNGGHLTITWPANRITICVPRTRSYGDGVVHRWRKTLQRIEDGTYQHRGHVPNVALCVDTPDAPPISLLSPHPK